MIKERMILEIPYYSQSVQGLIWDFQTYLSGQKIKHSVIVSTGFYEQVLGKGGFVKIKARGKTILIDVQDDPLNYPFFKDFDLVFKRSHSIFVQYADNVFPFGFRFDVFDGLYSVFFTNVKSFIFRYEARRELVRTMLNFLGFDFAGFNNLSRTYNNLNLAGTKATSVNKKKIMFSSRLFLELERGKKISEERKQIYELLKKRNDVLLNTLTPLNQSDYLKAIERSNVVVVNNGLYDVPGIRFPELLLMGKVVVSLPLNVGIPGLIDGVHYVSTKIEDLNECLDNLSLEEIIKIQTNAREFAQRHYGPGKRMAFIFNHI